MRKLANEELERISVEEFKNSDKIPVVVVLDNVRSLNNVGSAFRTSDAFLIEKIYLTGITGKPPHRDIQKTALGATESVNWEHVDQTKDLISRLKNQGYTIISIEQADKSIMLDQYTPLKDKKYCLVFGNEVFGVSDDVIEASDEVIEIPQFGTKHSINISVSMGIVIWDFFKALR